AIKSSFGRENLSYNVVILPDGEVYKNLKTMQKIYDKLLLYHADRRSILIGIGGGVVGDMTGFAASTYMRGIRYIQVPTTLLAQVDAAIGGKTGVDYSLVKNIVGTFYQPMLVYSNIHFLETLPHHIYRAGIAEVIKYGIIRDKNLFSYIQEHRSGILAQSPRSILKILYESSRIKAEFVEKDEKETSGIRMLLNFGHTFGHAIESSTQYRILHGEAVGIGMIIAAKISCVLDLCKKDVPEKIEQIIRDMKLPVSINNLDIQHLSKSINYDKKGEADKIALILLKDIGMPMVYKMDKKMLKKILMEVKL
ncbi:MAG: 3-dehydroquinate synthase, partial [Deltaproteobacteria bacterium]|nr:3-dehydroquinate synthase [Deltaproteobacteria bacterium]